MPTTMKSPVTGQYMLILLVSAWITLLYNGSFFARFTDVFPFDPGNAPFVVAAGLLLYFILVLLFAIPACKYVTKPLLMLSVMVAAVVSYYMSEYGAVIDTTMIQNMIETNTGEALGLISMEMVARLVFLGILPAWFILKWNITYRTAGRELLSKALVVSLSIAVSGVLLMSFSASFTSFFREYVSVRYYTNPVTAFYSGIIYVGAALTEQERPEHPEVVSQDAKIVHRDTDVGSGKPDRELVVLVVGEAVLGFIRLCGAYRHLFCFFFTALVFVCLSG